MKKSIKTNTFTRYRKQPVDPSAIAQTERDFKDALMMVSIFANLFILCLWIAVQTTAQYDAALIDFLIKR